MATARTDDVWNVEEILDALASAIESAAVTEHAPTFADTAWTKVLAGIIKNLPLEPEERVTALREALKSRGPLVAWIQKKILSVEGKRDLKGMLLIELKEK